MVLIIGLLANEIVVLIASTNEIAVLTRGVQYVMKTAQYIPKFYIYTLRNYFNLKVCFLAKYK